MLGKIKFDWLVAGLGNPGEKYRNTKHNIGWNVLDFMANKLNHKFVNRSYSDNFHINLNDLNIAFIKPNTFMNNSGEPIKRFSEHYDIPPERIVVICDEYNFEIGKIHLKFGGSDGGHNGVTSVIEHLNTRDFIRLRCGIGNNFRQGELIDYVLSEFKKEDEIEVKIMVQKAADAIEYLLNSGINRAMSEVNSGSLWKPSSIDII